MNLPNAEFGFVFARYNSSDSCADAINQLAIVAPRFSSKKYVPTVLRARGVDIGGKVGNRKRTRAKKVPV